MGKINADGIHHFPMQGVELWKNPKNQFLVFQCHYTADPTKRDPAYRKEKESSLPRRRFLMEYEIHWESFSGLPVFGDTWNEKTHTSKEEMLPELGLPILLGFDFGLTPACVVAQLRGRRLFCIKEYVAVNMGAERFVSIIIKDLRINFPHWADFKKDYLVFIDPSGEFRKDTDEGTCAKIIDAKGFGRVIPGAIAFEERRTSVEEFLTKMEGGLPCMTISAGGCPMLVKGFNGGYMFKEGQDEIEPNKLVPLKNEYSHVQDALQMITSRILKMTSRIKSNVPVPSYGWMR